MAPSTAGGARIYYTAETGPGVGDPQALGQSKA